MSYPGSGDPSERAYGRFGAPPNPSDRVIPPPGYPKQPAPPAPGSGPVPAQPVFHGGDPTRPPTPPNRPLFTGSAPSNGGAPSNGSGGGLWIIVGVLVVVALTLGGVFAWLLVSGDDTDSAALSVSETVIPQTTAAPGSAQSPVVLPAGAQTCPASVASSNDLRSSAVGTTVTSCPFAEEVRLAYRRAGSDRSTRIVVATSPVTGKLYDMHCASAGRLVTCRGGENAVVYLF